MENKTNEDKDSSLVPLLSVTKFSKRLERKSIFSGVSISNSRSPITPTFPSRVSPLSSFVSPFAEIPEDLTKSSIASFEIHLIPLNEAIWGNRKCRKRNAIRSAKMCLSDTTGGCGMSFCFSSLVKIRAIWAVWHFYFFIKIGLHYCYLSNNTMPTEKKINNFFFFCFKCNITLTIDLSPFFPVCSVSPWTFFTKSPKENRGFGDPIWSISCSCSSVQFPHWHHLDSWHHLMFTKDFSITEKLVFFFFVPLFFCYSFGVSNKREKKNHVEYSLIRFPAITKRWISLVPS